MNQEARTKEDLPVRFLREVSLRDVLNDPRLKRELHNWSVIEEISRRPGYLGDFFQRVQETYNRERKERAEQARQECKSLATMRSWYH